MFALLASASFPDATVTVFEPNPENFKLIRSNCSLNALDWDCRLAAVGAAAGEAYLEIYNSHSARLSTKRGVPTKIFELRAFIASLGPCRLVFKIDVEGEERVMWPDLIPSLPTESVVFFETHHGGEAWLDAESHFRRNGFVVRRVVDRGQYCDGVATRVPL